jgi:hypothetical protein
VGRRRDAQPLRLAQHGIGPEQPPVRTRAMVAGDDERGGRVVACQPHEVTDEHVNELPGPAVEGSVALGQRRIEPGRPGAIQPTIALAASHARGPAGRDGAGDRGQPPRLRRGLRLSAKRNYIQQPTTSTSYSANTGSAVMIGSFSISACAISRRSKGSRWWSGSAPARSVC